MSKRQTPYLCAGDPGEHPAAVAWARLSGDGAAPNAVHVLKDPRGSSSRTGVYRLENLAFDGTAVIAKRCSGNGAHLERHIYETVLPSLSIARLHSYGSTDDPDGSYSWLFLEEAKGIEYSSSQAAHRTLGIEFLTALHTRAANFGFRDRGPAYYRRLLELTQDSIPEYATHPALSGEEVKTLYRLSHQFDRLAAAWEGLEAVCSRVPETLVHGDFVEKNLRVRTTAERSIILAYDWGEAGRAIPAIDICKVDPHAYATAVTRVWTHVDAADLLMLSSVGTAFRCVVAVSWAASSFRYEWVEDAMHKLRAYEARLSRALETAPWAN